MASLKRRMKVKNYKEYSEKRDAYNKASEEFRKAESKLVAEILDSAKYKVGDKVLVTGNEGWGNTVGKKGIISSVHTPTFRYNGQAKSVTDCFATYKLNKINKDGSMHKTASLDYCKFGESDIEII